MSTDGCDPVPTADDMTAVDHDHDGYAETLQWDQNRDGYAETLLIDRDLDGVTEETQIDSDLDGRVDTQLVDDDLDGATDRTYLDTDGDGDLEQQGQSVIPPGQPGGEPVDQGLAPTGEPADQGMAPTGEPAEPFQLPTDMSGQSPEDLAQWLNHPNVQDNPELKQLIKDMLAFGPNSGGLFLR